VVSLLLILQEFGEGEVKITKSQLSKLIKEAMHEQPNIPQKAHRDRSYDYTIGRGFERSELSDDYLALVEKVNALNFEKLEEMYPGISELKERIFTEERLTLQYIDMYLDTAQYEKIIPMIKAADRTAADLGRTRPGNKSWSS
jgi:hypothetical protein